MAGVRKLKPSGKWEISLVHKLLPKRRTHNFDDELTARDYGTWAETELAAGRIPSAPTGRTLQPRTKIRRDYLGPVLRAWLDGGSASQSDIDVIGPIWDEMSGVLLHDMDYRWCLEFVRNLKVKANLSPGTIRKRVGVLGRALEDWSRRYPELQLVNHLRALPKGYATYSQGDTQQAVAQGNEHRIDQTRDRRLIPGEEARIVAALDGFKRDDRERPLLLPEGRAMLVLFSLILHTGARLVEAYALTRGQIDLDNEKVIRFKTSKGRVGAPASYRKVPIQPQLFSLLSDWLIEVALPAGKGTNNALVFPFWDGKPETLRQAGHKLSQRFRNIFDYADCPGLREHDLRHEATCRWFEQRTRDGHWMFREAEINRLMGWTSNSTMALRYGSFRGEDLSARLWANHEPIPPAPTALRLVS